MQRALSESYIRYGERGAQAADAVMRQEPGGVPAAPEAGWAVRTS
jgi:hypothetical protein